jgi:hypothetical protein
MHAQLWLGLQPTKEQADEDGEDEQRVGEAGSKGSEGSGDAAEADPCLNLLHRLLSVETISRETLKVFETLLSLRQSGARAILRHLVTACGNIP